MEVIEVSKITKDYGNQKGVFDVSFSVKKGEILGFLGPNGAGKTTTIRQLMGFIRPDQGSVEIEGRDCFHQAQEIQKNLGYLPGEIAFMDAMTGNEFIFFLAKMKGIRDMGRIKELIRFFELDASGKIRKMSKGMKQKIGIVCAFMQNPDILILDEPTSGLDPLMQNKFVELIRKERERGATILMSSHIFEEIENTCDRVVMIKDGRIIQSAAMDDFKKSKKKKFQLIFQTEEDAQQFSKVLDGSIRRGKMVTVPVSGPGEGGIDRLIREAGKYHLVDMNLQTQTLEELFLHYYGGRDK